MIKSLYLCFVFIILLTIIDSRCHLKWRIVSISSGTSFGRCIGYCRRSINIISYPSQLIALKEPNYDQPAYPIVSQQYPYSTNQWKQLLTLVSSKGFRALNDTIGCPDCADGGAEWIQINWPDISKRVTFEYKQTITGFEKLVNESRILREKYANNL